MAELAPYPIGALARRMFRELETGAAIFDLPARKFVLGHPTRDFSVRFHDRIASTPFGPAAGPNTQFAQNIVLSWLAGGRVLELKTVQIKDELKIPRPCIDMQTVGYNIEWSQELKLEQSLEEYAKAALLIRMLEESGKLPFAPGMGRTIYDMSVGYDLAGIRSERVLAFIRGMMDATAVLERLRREIPHELAQYRDVPVEPCLSSTLTLSTFHGCPPDEIERIIDFLLREQHLNCIVKLNPMLLGKTEVRGLLHDALGYADLRVPDSAFDRDTTWDQAVDFVGRLGETAAGLGLGFGVKFSNTLIVENHRKFFPASEREMYLSGPPLHVLAIHLVARFRRSFADRFPISFSAGIERANFPDAVALGLVPITVCSDLLKPGGYGRPHGYFDELARRMDAVRAASVDEFMIKAYGEKGAEETEGAKGTAGSEAVSAAKLRNTEVYVERVTRDPRYRAERNARPPRKIGSKLALLDCVSCDKCVPVCPNDANFSVALQERMPRQWVNFADFCNDCGNCDVFCPEDGGPYIVKPRVFISRERWLKDAPRDAILVEPDAVTGRFDGTVIRVTHEGPAASDDPRAQILRRLGEALFAPGEINYVNQFLGSR